MATRWISRLSNWKHSWKSVWVFANSRATGFGAFYRLSMNRQRRTNSAGSFVMTPIPRGNRLFGGRASESKQE
jgi:hypothetical protein